MFLVGVAFLEGHAFDHAVRVFHVVGVVRNGIVAVITAARPDAFHQLRLAAVGGGVVALGQLAFVKAAHAVGLLHGFFRVAVAGDIPPEDLIVGGVHHVVVRVRATLAQDVGAGGHGLGLQRLQGERVAHFIGHDPQQVILHVQGQNGQKRALRNFQPQIALIQSRIIYPAEADLGGARVGVSGQGQVSAAVQGQRAAVNENAAFF